MFGIAVAVVFELKETRISFQYLLYVSDSIAHLFFNVVRQPDELYFQNIKCRLLLVPVKHNTYQKGKENKESRKNNEIEKSLSERRRELLHGRYIFTLH